MEVVNSSLSKRLSLAKTIFTTEEYNILLRYEILSLFELGKQKLEWFLYGLIILVWFGVVTCLAMIPKLSNPHTINPSVSLALPKQEIEQLKIQKENERVQKVCEEIDKVSLSNLSSQEIFNRVTYWSNQFGIDRFFVLALIEKECNFKETAIAKDHNTTGSLGWSQATKSTWDAFNTKYIWSKYHKVYESEDRLDPDKSLEFICWYLTYLKNNFKDIITLEDLYTAYNGGPYGLHKESARSNARICIKNYNKYKNVYLNY